MKTVSADVIKMTYWVKRVRRETKHAQAENLECNTQKLKRKKQNKRVPF